MIRNLQIKSSLGYGIAMALSVTYFLLVSPGLRDSPIPWAAGIGSTLAAFGAGWVFGKWYVPVHGERPSFELLACPFMILMLSLTSGLIILFVWLVASDPSQVESLMAFFDVLVFGFWIFIYEAWPAITSAFGATGVWLAWCSLAASDS